MAAKTIPFEDLETADLIVDAIYEGGSNGNAGDDPISRLMGCGNQGGFRYIGSYQKPDFCVLYSELSHSDWPDELNAEQGQFIYYGDNRTPGHQLHETRKKGNLVLKHAFDALHSGARREVPPFFIFTKVPEAGRSVCFRGLAVPGSSRVSQTDDLVAIWKSFNGSRFQNYKAVFTILDVPVVGRRWLQALRSGQKDVVSTPTVFSRWQTHARYDALIAPPSVTHRTKSEQLPQTAQEHMCVKAIKEYFSQHPEREYAFEKCASALVQLMDENIISCDNTRPWRDGGRDATGVYRIGLSTTYTDVEFSMEAKCYALDNECGVKETSRLISRLRHRQFGIFVTTSYVALQAYKEIIEDRHPVLIVAARDIGQLLIAKGYAEHDMLNKWLKQF
jgi:hypothetical protein